MAIRIDEITSADWSPMVGSPGAVVEGIADIEQCIDIIVTTPKGSDPHRPLFGCDAWKWVDAPPSVAVPNIVMEVIDSLTLWEPRIELVKVLPAAGVAGATVTIVWQRPGDAQKYIREVSIGNAA